MIHVCSLARLHDTVAQTRASHMVTLLRLIDRVERPRTIAPDKHLILGMDDIAMPMDGYTHPAEEHVTELIRFRAALGSARAAGDALLRGHQPVDRRRLHLRLRAEPGP